MILLILTVLTISFITLMFWMSHLCAKEMTCYWIKKDKHYSIRPMDLIPLPYKLGLVNKDRIEFNVMFSEGTSPDNWYEDRSIHKLYGMTFGFDVHYRSLRIGWQTMGGEIIRLYAYYYLEGKRYWTELCNVHCYENYRIVMQRENDELYQVLVYNSEEINSLIGGTVVAIEKKYDAIRFKLFPYYGGKNKAENDVRIYIKEK